MANQAGYVPTETEEQQALFEWASMMSGVHPELKLMYHVPNEGKRSKAAAGILKSMGLKRGVPDICLPVPRGRFHGLYVELKRVKGGKATKEQLWWLEQLDRQGYAVTICRGWKQASQNILAYLNLVGGKSNDNRSRTSNRETEQ